MLPFSVSTTEKANDLFHGVQLLTSQQCNHQKSQLTHRLQLSLIFLPTPPNLQTTNRVGWTQPDQADPGGPVLILSIQTGLVFPTWWLFIVISRCQKIVEFKIYKKKKKKAHSISAPLIRAPQPSTKLLKKNNPLLFKSVSSVWWLEWWPSKRHNHVLTHQCLWMWPYLEKKASANINKDRSTWNIHVAGP